MSPAHQPRDVDLERAIGRVLRLGVLTATVCLAAGLLLALTGMPTFPDVLLRAGLMLLLATPVARVIVSVVDYLREHDWLFVTLTVIVLLQLAASVVVAVMK